MNDKVTLDTQTVFDEVLAELVELGAITRVKALAITCPVEQGYFVPRLEEEGVDPESIAEAIATVFDLELFDNQTIVREFGNGWVLSTEGTVYFTRPQSKEFFEFFQNHRRDKSVVSTGIISTRRYNDISFDAEHEIQDFIPENDDNAGEKLLTQILEASIQRHSTDVHIEPLDAESVVVKCRVDGRLIPINISISIGNGFESSAYKSLANVLLTAADKEPGSFRMPQSGQFVFSNVSIRMEMVPSKIGLEIIPIFVLRILGQKVTLDHLPNLGFSAENLKKYQDIARKHPHGLILVSGPTASGKSTTLYAWMKHISDTFPARSFYTLEDPVEKQVRGFRQVEVGKSLTFQTGLRSLLRADPDVIMVGEIRDKETADLGLRASMTGHLVLATLHANSALKSISRLIEMGLDPILLADSIVCVTAQRMVQKVCQNCKKEVLFGDTPEYSTYSQLKNAPAASEYIYAANDIGCDTPGCVHGYNGRHLINEIVRIDSELQEVIGKKATSAELMHTARDKGQTFLWDDGMRLVAAGITTIDALEMVLEPLD